jgi:hypothetical protein
MVVGAAVAREGLRDPSPQVAQMDKCKWVRVSGHQAGRQPLLDNDGSAEPKPVERLRAQSLPTFKIPN